MSQVGVERAAVLMAEDQLEVTPEAAFQLRRPLPEILI